MCNSLILQPGQSQSHPDHGTTASGTLVDPMFLKAKDSLVLGHLVYRQLPKGLGWGRGQVLAGSLHWKGVDWGEGTCYGVLGSCSRWLGKVKVGVRVSFSQELKASSLGFCGWSVLHRPLSLTLDTDAVGAIS